jgi:uncharacterized RDD family membrane protein YckC
MIEQRNPYAATNVPLEVRRDPAHDLATGEMEYGTFWRRVAAQLLDCLIFLPLSLLAVFGFQYTRFFYSYYLVPALVVMAFYGMYLVKRYGGTPGKRILDLKVVMADGAPVTANAAVLRHSVAIVLSALGMLGLAVAGQRISDAEFGSLGLLEKLAQLGAHAPSWNQPLTYVNYAWYATLAIVMLCNARRRASHDFLAGTVVVRTD